MKRNEKQYCELAQNGKKRARTWTHMKKRFQKGPHRLGKRSQSTHTAAKRSTSLVLKVFLMSIPESRISLWKRISLKIYGKCQELQKYICSIVSISGHYALNFHYLRHQPMVIQYLGPPKSFSCRALERAIGKTNQYQASSRVVSHIHLQEKSSSTYSPGYDQPKVQQTPWSD